MAGYRWAAEHTRSAALVAGWWGTLGAVLHQRYELAGAPDDLDAAVDAAEHALDCVVPGSTDQTRVRSQLAQVLVERHRRDGDAATLDRAVGMLEQVVSRTPPEHPARGGRASNLAIALMDRWHLTGDPADVERAGALFAAAADGAHQTGDAVGEALHWNNLAMVALGRYRRGVEPAELDTAVDLLERAVAVDPSARYRVNLGDALALRHDHGGDADDLRRAVAAHRLALDALAPGAPLRVEAMRGLANGLLARFERDGVVRDLHDAVELLRAAVDATPLTSPDLAGNLNDLGNVLRTTYRHTGSTEALDEAHTAFERALDVAGETASDRAVYLDNLASVLSERPLAGVERRRRPRARRATGRAAPAPDRFAGASASHGEPRWHVVGALVAQRRPGGPDPCGRPRQPGRGRHPRGFPRVRAAPEHPGRGAP